MLHRWVLICLVGRLGCVAGGNGHDQGKLDLAPRRELLRREHDQNLKASPAAFKEYRFTVSKTRQPGDVFHISEFFLLDQAGEVVPLNTPTTVLSISNSQVISDDPRNLVDNNPFTGIRLNTAQSITVKLQQTNVLVAGFGFKTAQNQDAKSQDPTSFRLEGSMDGSTWYLLSQKAGYNTPETRGALVGPFMVSKLAALALQGDKTLPGSAFPTNDLHRPFERAAVSGSLSSQQDIARRATTTLPEAASGAVAAAVVDASADAGLDPAETAATAAAAAAALEAASTTAPAASAEARLAAAAEGAGLTPQQVAMVTATLQSVDSSHWEAIVNAWTAVAAKKSLAESAEDKVAAVVSASGDAGFTVAQQADAAAVSAAAAAVAATAAVAPGGNVVGEALVGAELQPESKAAVADAAAKELPQNQEAIAHVLRAAGMMATTTLLPLVDVSDPDARVILNAVVKKLENATVDPEEKVRIANAAAEAYMKRMASTTSFDGLGMVVRAAEELGLAHAQVKRMAETAEHLTVAEQLAAATALRAATEGADVLSPEDPAEQVAAVVRAEAHAGVPEPQQASAAAQAVTVAARKAKKAKLAEQEDSVLSRIVKEALKIGLAEEQAEAILDVVSSMSSEEQAVIEKYLISLLSPVKDISTSSMMPVNDFMNTATTAMPSLTTGAPKAPSMPTSGEGAATFMFHVVPSSSSRSSYKAETGLSAKGFIFGVALDVPGVVEFIESQTGKEVEPFELSLAYGSFLFSWPSTDDCSAKESGFTDFQAITFYNGTFANPGQTCGDLLATSMDLDGVLRFPSAGDTDLFRVAGMFGSQYEEGGGDAVTLSIQDLLIYQIKASGDKVEYRLCGDVAGASYLGCPNKSPLKIKYPEKSLGQGVKICSGQSHFHEYKLENCFSV